MLRRILLVIALVLGFLSEPSYAVVRFAYHETAISGVNGPLVIETINQLQKELGPNNFVVQRMEHETLLQAIERNEIDLFLASSAFYRQMLSNSARDIATAQSTKAIDPNHSEGSVFLVKGERLDLMNFSNLKGKRIAVSRHFGFSGYETAIGELLLRGFPVKDFFAETVYLPADVKVLLDTLKSGRVDAIVLPTCLLEWFTSKSDYDTSWLRVLQPRQYSTLRCVHSTALYPNLTLASLPTLPSSLSRIVTQTLLNMKPVEGGLYWGIATDFQWVDNLLRRLELDAWAKDREWTVAQLVNKYRIYLFVLLGILAALGVQSVALSILVRRRTRQLSLLLNEQKRLRVQAQESSRRIEQLQKIGVIGQLSTLFAHELGQPLNSIICYSFGVEQMVAKGIVDKAAFSEAIQEIGGQARRAHAIVEKVRDYVRARDREKVVTDWGVILKQAIRNFSATQSFRGDIVLDAPYPVLIMADPLELELIAINLMRNAAEAQHGVAHASIKVALETMDGYGVMTVTDCGPAIDYPSFIKQLEQRKSNKDSGLGVGLSIVQALVEMHAGHVRFSQSRTGGLKVIVSIPLEYAK